MQFTLAMGSLTIAPMNRTIPCVLMRAGTSRGPFFLREWLPTDERERDEALIGAIAVVRRQPFAQEERSPGGAGTHQDAGDRSVHECNGPPGHCKSGLHL